MKIENFSLNQTKTPQFRPLNFAPLAVLQKLANLHTAHGGQAALVLIDRELHAHFLWNYGTDNLLRLMTLKNQGAWIVGFMAFSDRDVLTFPEIQTADAPLFQSILNTWADIYRKDKHSRAHRELNELIEVWDRKIKTCQDNEYQQVSAGGLLELGRLQEKYPEFYSQQF